ncbi:hypothetical protein Snoj_28480 [Streptomyces nojiriensis]|uniref:Uncharacterized protein n=1 Tax=Streptomyces nojiriensis TaxID=66374 RepID=A0ABQ3SLB7_9ACTN|nr:hypothetical protein [Streptomyces nojiriensis]QTI42527.1 hypothetical protein JYK04_00285 [Streptomyces nojiriensis]GGS39163.1 hypothetical protein GCM10010205_81120 [Streptomyces nojiriensis]GHI68930.1 hypothetical protein Snoj_28480 [Streptomyces nojiriensis]
MTEPLPRRTTGVSRRKAAAHPLPGSPSRDLRLRAAGGWEKFMRRTEIQPGDET